MSTRAIAALIVSLLLPHMVGLVGAAVTIPAVAEWYPGLAKPPLTAPDWVFAPAWLALYTLMGLAAFLVWHGGPRRPGVRPALLVYAVQLALNGLWSPVFFGLHAVGAALAVIVLLLAVVVETIRRFVALSPVAAGLLVPYALWLAYALYLNAGVWALN